MLFQRLRLSSLATHSLLTCPQRTLSLALPSQIHSLSNGPKNLSCCCVKPTKQNGFNPDANNDRQSSSSSSSSSFPKDSPFSGMEDALVSYLFGKKKATDLAHMVWKHVVRKRDTVIDATCGNGFDTLAMLNLVADNSHQGCVYALDIQKDALDNTSILLEESLNSDETQLVKLFNICHSKMEEVVPTNASVRLVAFNLGYLPGGDKEIITRSETTLLALEAAKRILMPGGLISIVVYVGHLGGREELKAVEAFAAGMSVEDWICCKLQMLNRPCAPVPIFLFRRCK